MTQVLVVRNDQPHTNADSLKGMFRFRHKVFYERLGWEVGSHNGMERDGFDDLDPVYMMAEAPGKNVEGCWRLLPTTGPYMLEETFPQLLRGTSVPKDPAIWEISRFAVLPSASSSSRQATLCSITFDILRAGVDFADRNGIRHYVFVTSVAVERLLKRAGLPLRRFGDGRAQKVGKVLSVACWIDIDDETRRAVYNVGEDAAAVEAA